MTIVYASRKTLRQKLADLLETELVGESKPVSSVYPYFVEDFSASPVVCVASGGTATRPFGMGSVKGFNVFQFQIMLFSASSSVDDSWTSENAQDAHDDIEAGIRKVIHSNRNVAGYWQNLHFAGQKGNDTGAFSTIAPVLISGQKYDLEIIQVELEAHDYESNP